MNETYTRAEVEYMLKRACQEVYAIVYKCGYLSREDSRMLINRLLDKHR